MLSTLWSPSKFLWPPELMIYVDSRTVNGLEQGKLLQTSIPGFPLHIFPPAKLFSNLLNKPRYAVTITLLAVTEIYTRPSWKFTPITCYFNTLHYGLKLKITLIKSSSLDVSQIGFVSLLKTDKLQRPK